MKCKYCNKTTEKPENWFHHNGWCNQDCWQTWITETLEKVLSIQERYAILINNQHNDEFYAEND